MLIICLSNLFSKTPNSIYQTNFKLNIKTVGENKHIHSLHQQILNLPLAQSAGAAEYTDCISGYDTKQSDCEASVILKLWGTRNTPLLLSLPGPLWPGVVASDSVLFMGKKELNCVLMIN